MVVMPYVKRLSEAFARILKAHGIATANCPHRTLWNFVYIQRTRSRIKRRPNWSIVCLARTPPAHTLERQAGSSVWESRKKEVDSFTAGTQTRASSKGEQCNSQVSHHTACHGRWKRTVSSTGTRQKWSTESDITLLFWESICSWHTRKRTLARWRSPPDSTLITDHLHRWLSGCAENRCGHLL